MLLDRIISAIGMGFRTRHRVWLRYPVAIFCVALATSVRVIFLQSLGTHFTFLYFYPAVMIAAFYGGLPAGLVATVLSALEVDFFLMEPLGTFYDKNSAGLLGLICFCASCAAVSLIIEAMHRGHIRANEAETAARLATERKKVDIALLESEELLQQATRVAQSGIFQHDHLTDSIYWSPIMHEIFGSAPHEAVTLRAFLDYIHPEDRERVGAAVLRAHDPAGSGLFDVEYRIIRRDGAVRWMSTRCQTFFDNEGGVRRKVRTVGATLDVTERKLAEERIRAALLEKETLLKELYHRTKNNMQVISSLINLQAARVGESGVQYLAQETRNRIRAMALVHEKLYKSSNLSNIDMKEYIGDLARSIFDNYENVAGQISLDLMFDDIQVPIECAIPSGLILNELISNSVKHAFPGDRRGEIRVALYWEGERLHLEYADNGVGLGSDYEDLKKKSMGLLVVEALIKQVGGAMEITNRSGAGYIIKFGKQVKQIKSFI